MLSNIVAEHSIALMAESAQMMERAAEEVLGMKVETCLPRLTGTRDAHGVETIYLDGKPIMRMWPVEITFETLPDKVVTRATRRWQKL